jgi:hypothetical protein
MKNCHKITQVVTYEEIGNMNEDKNHTIITCPQEILIYFVCLSNKMNNYSKLLNIAQKSILTCKIAVANWVLISVTESKLSTWSIAYGLVLRIWDAKVNNEPSQILFDPSNVAFIFGWLFEHTTKPYERIGKSLESSPLKATFIVFLSIGAYITYDPT